MGESSRYLAIFLSECRYCKPALIIHECTSFFAQWLFGQFLPEYTVNKVDPPEGKEQLGVLSAGFASGTWLLSPHQFWLACLSSKA